MAHSTAAQLEAPADPVGVKTRPDCEPIAAGLRDIWHGGDTQGNAVPDAAPIKAPSIFLVAAARQIERIKWEAELLTAALDAPPNSRARGAILADLASRTHRLPDGTEKRFSVRTLRDKCAAITAATDNGEPAPMMALARKPRALGSGAALITRQWDAACPLPPAEKERIAAEIATYCRSQWRALHGWKMVAEFGSSKLRELSIAAGWDAASKAHCALTKTFVNKFKNLRRVGIKERDAKRHADHYLPRIVRSTKGLKPADVVVGDVHPHDVLIETKDGRRITARLISWLDLATRDVHVTVVFLPKGRGIRQEDVIRSFVEMVERFGLPRRLYLDNGTEFKAREMIEGFNALTALVSASRDFIAELLNTDELNALLAEPGNSAEPAAASAPGEPAASRNDNAITRARPYNAAAKQIEAVFGNLESRFFSTIPGYMGGDRLNKMTPRLGAQPKPFPGGETELDRVIHTRLDMYRCVPGNDGKSVNDRWAEPIAAGWVKTPVDRAVLLLAFSIELRPKVMNSGIEANGQTYMADVLIPLIGDRVTIRAAKWDTAQVIYIDPDNRPHVVPLVKSFDGMDPAGAVESGRGIGLLNRHLSELAKTAPKLDQQAEVERHLATQDAPPVIPAGPAIVVDAQAAALREALANPPAATIAPPIRPGDMKHPKTGEVIRLRAPEEERPADVAASTGLLDALKTFDPESQPKPAPPAFDLSRPIFIDMKHSEDES